MMVRVRFAPSPTGFIHIGNARTALFNYLFAKKEKGEFILRVEDTDKERSRREYTEKLMEDLKWLGLEWDEGPDIGGEFGPYLQSQRAGIHSEYIAKLLKENRAYYCFCSESELEERRKKRLREGKSIVYDGKCRNLPSTEVEKRLLSGVPASIRFKVPDEKIIVSDIIRGDVEFDLNMIGDFIIARPDGTPTFHLAVVVDDGLMKITHVIRGEDHFSNTPKHIALFKALGFEIPKFAHMPLTMGPGGEPLSKRFGAMSISEYRKLGYLPQALANYMALLGWSPGNDKEIFTFDELKKVFNLNRVSKSAAVFDIVKLNWVSGEHIRMLSDEEYVQKAVQYVLREKIVDKEIYKARPEWYERVFLALKDNIQYFNELEDRLKMFGDDFEYSNPDILKTEESVILLKELRKILKDMEIIEEDEYDKILKFLKKKTKLKGKSLFLPLRMAVTGREHGPDLKRFFIVLGKNNLLKRVEKSLRITLEK